MGGPRQQRYLTASNGTQRLGVTLTPILVDQRAVPQITNPRTAAPQKPAQHPRLGQQLEHRRGLVGQLLQRRTQVGRPQ